MTLDVAQIEEDTLNATTLEEIRRLHTVILAELQKVTDRTKRNMQQITAMQKRKMEFSENLSALSAALNNLKLITGYTKTFRRTYGVRENRVLTSEISKQAKGVLKNLSALTPHLMADVEESTENLQNFVFEGVNSLSSYESE